MALEMRATCERCNAGLDAAGEAYVCSYECTFCRACRDAISGVCPNCGGELLKRPRRGVKAEPDTAPALAEGGALALTPAPPYYAVTFTSLRTPVDAGYDETSARMLALASRQPGYLGIESARSARGLGITTSYWRSLDDVRAWKAVDEHRRAQQRGRDEWYAAYKTRVSRVEYDYGFEAGRRSER
jgi:heme-degrading monooxygenase HmoA